MVGLQRATGIRAETTAQKWALSLVLTGVTALCARLSAPLPFTPIPMTFAVFAVLLSGLLLGKRWGAVAQLQYLALGAMGAPIFALGTFGPAVLFGITGGYLIAYPIAAFIVGWVAGEDRSPAFWRGLVACFAGLAVLYTMGSVRYAMLVPHAALAVFLEGALVFLAWDCVKAVLAVVIASGRQIVAR